VDRLKENALTAISSGQALLSVVDPSSQYNPPVFQFLATVQKFLMSHYLQILFDLKVILEKGQKEGLKQTCGEFLYITEPYAQYIHHLPLSLYKRNGNELPSEMSNPLI
jgi:hypothetical protein